MADTVRDVVGKVTTWLMRWAAREEREACARLCEEHCRTAANDDAGRQLCLTLAAKIRARG